MHGFESYEELDRALTALGLYPTDTSLIDELKRLRTSVAKAPKGDPALFLLLSGPGDPAQVADEAAAAAMAEADGAIIIPTGPFDYQVLILTNDVWQWFAVTGTPPAANLLMPGDADRLMSAAINQAAERIAQAGHSVSKLEQPRLLIGSLTDFYETPGLPAALPPRAGKLIARTDRASAIVALTFTLDHSFDPELLGLSRHIRQARMSAVAYCLADWGRLAS